MFSIFNPKKNITQTSLLEEMTEIHSHLLPGVDDGVQTLQESVSALHLLMAQGVRQIYFTPHIMADNSGNNKEFLGNHFQQLKKAFPYGIDIRLAAEYMLDSAFESHLKDGLLTMKDKHVLVETSYLSPPPDLLDMLYTLSVEGYIPMIAHPERYVYMSAQDFTFLKGKGYKLQMNLFSLSGYYGLHARRNSEHLLKEGLYDFVGSDIHSSGKYKKGLQLLNLTRRQIKELHKLLENNHSLW